jgi:ketosteroid isomerase-like protein
MSKTVMSRRTLLRAGACSLIAAATIPEIAAAYAETESGPKNEATVRKYYAAWEGKDWRPIDMLLVDDFTFTSPVDDHISKSTFKTRCWDTQNALIERLDLKRVVATGNEAFVLYVGHTTNGKTFRNVEYLRLKGEQVRAVECYFGAQNNFPSAVSEQK